MDKQVTEQELKEAVGALRSEIAKLNPNKEVIEKINATLDKQEQQNQKLVSDMGVALKHKEEMTERVHTLELELARKGGAGAGRNYKDTDEYKALNLYCKNPELVQADQKALLRTDTNVDGGFLVAAEMDTTMIKKITEIDAFRALARVRTIASKSIMMPVRTGILSGAYEGEAEEGDTGNSKYGTESMTPFRMSVTVPITQDMLMDASFDMESEIMQDVAEAFAFLEGNKFITGTGVKQPEGIISNTTLQAAARETAASGVLDAKSVILLTGDLKVGYNPSYVMNRTTLAYLRTLRSDAVVAADQAGLFLWQPGMNGSVANTINGFPYAIMPSMQDIAASAYSIGFGDWRRGYTITDRTGTTVVRDNVTRKKAAIIEFTVHRWNTGKVVLTEAIKLLKVKA